MISPPAFGTRHDHDITGTKEDGGRFCIAGWPAEQEDRGTSDTAGIGGQREKENRAGVLTIRRPEGWQCRSLTGQHGPLVYPDCEAQYFTLR